MAHKLWLLGFATLLGACSGDSKGGALPTASGGAGQVAPPGTGGTVGAQGGSGPGAVPSSTVAGGTPGGLPGTGSAGAGVPPGGASNGGVTSGGGSTSSGGAPSGGTSMGGASNGGVGGTAGSGPGGAGGETNAPLLAVSADFLNQTLSIFDVSKFTQGATRKDVLVGTVDLSKYVPGPLAMGITPDGKTALVSISGGFLGAFTTVPPGAGTLLFVDLEKRAVSAELYTGNSPMGIAITKDGKRAFVGQYSETYFADVDVEKHTFVPIQTGSTFNEEVALDDSGTVGILSYGPQGNCVTFPVDMAATPLGVTIGLTGDAGGVAFFPGTKTAYVVQAPTTLTGNVGGHNVVDVSNPRSPVASDNVRVANSPIYYPVTAVAHRGSVVFPSTQSGKLTLVEMKLDGGVATMVQAIPVGDAQTLAYGVAANPDGKVLIAVPTEHYVAAVDLATAKVVTVPWGVDKAGPNDVKFIP